MIMLKKLSVKLALIYGLVVLITILLIDGILIYIYSNSLFNKNEASCKAFANELAYMAAENIANGSNSNSEYFIDRSRIVNIISMRAMAEDLIMENGRKIDGRVLMLDIAGNVLADSFKTYKYNTISNNEIREAIKEKSDSTGYYYLNNKMVMMQATPIINRWQAIGVVLISKSVQDINVAVVNYRNQVIGISALVTFLILTISLIMGKTISTPIEKLTTASEEILKGNLAVKVNISRNDEIGRLALTFNKMSEELNNIDTNRRRFISDVSHELKTPLTSIKALIESLLSGHNDIDTYREYLTDVDHELDRLTGLVRSLLVVTRLDEVQMKLEGLSIHEEVDKVVKLFRPLADEKGIDINNRCDKQVYINADRDRLKEVLINLVDNSIKYGREKGVIDISSKIEDSTVTLSIRDNGCGIPEEALPFIFDNFYRADDARSRDKGGSGIGLFIVKKIAGLHGWQMDVKSVVEEGTEFVIKMGKGAGVDGR